MEEYRYLHVPPDDFLKNGILYRFLRDPDYADQFVAGNIFISTLSECRGYEAAAGRGDPGEGTLRHRSGDLILSGDNPEDLEIARRAGLVIIPGGGTLTLSGNVAEHKLEDAYVLCTTERFSPDKLSDTFGKHCVRIDDAKTFFDRTSRALVASLKSGRLDRAFMGCVSYTGRELQGRQQQPAPNGFLKPPDLYADQQEVRMLWSMTPQVRLEPFLLKVPDVRGLCTRMT